MTDRFVRSGAGGAGTGVDWANAFTTLTLAFAGSAAGDRLWVADDHAESTASAVTLTSPGTLASPCLLYCVDHTQASPGTNDLRTTATVTTTGNSNLTLQSSSYYYGIIFQCGSGANATVLTIGSDGSGWHRFDSCQLAKLATTTSTAAISFGGGATLGSFVELVNTTVKFGVNNGDGIRLSGRLRWKNTASAIAGTNIPTNLFSNTPISGDIILEGVDLSAMVSGKTIFAATSGTQSIFLKDCKLASGVTVAATPASPAHREIFVVRSDSSGTNYRSEKYSYRGTETTETTIVRTGGASDGATPQSRKLVTTANSLWVAPFEALPITIWNDSTAAMTISLFGTWGGGVVPNNDDIWMDIEYLGDASTPQGSFLSGTKANNLATGTAQSSDSSTWGGGTTNFKMVSSSFTPAQKGPITIYVRAAKASTTFYIDPQPSITGISTPRSYVVAPGVVLNELSGVIGARTRVGL